MSEIQPAEKMTEFEICQSYREAKDPAAQIKILAQLNCCSTQYIRKILTDNNEPIRKKQSNPKNAKKVRPPKTEVKTKLPEEVIKVIRERLEELNDYILDTQLVLEKNSNEYKALAEFLDKAGVEVFEKSDK